MNFSIELIDTLPGDFDTLIQQSEREGFSFLHRLESEWIENKNRFSKNGEFLLAEKLTTTTIGVCGVNIDPYTAESEVARLRHLYVSPDYRSEEIGSSLVRKCLQRLDPKFTAIRLRVPSLETGRFYEKLGFQAIDEDCASHIVRM